MKTMMKIMFLMISSMAQGADADDQTKFLTQPQREKYDAFFTQSTHDLKALMEKQYTFLRTCVAQNINAANSIGEELLNYIAHENDKISQKKPSTQTLLLNVILSENRGLSPIAEDPNEASLNKQSYL